MNTPDTIWLINTGDSLVWCNNPKPAPSVCSKDVVEYTKVKTESDDPVKAFLELGEDLINKYPFLYVELARVRVTDWMAWICSHNQDTHPDRTVLVKGQGTTAEEACAKALTMYSDKLAEVQS
jgi:hypothetical protein